MQAKTVSNITKEKLKKALKKSFGAWGMRKDLGTTKSFVRKLRKERIKQN